MRGLHTTRTTLSFLLWAAPREEVADGRGWVGEADAADAAAEEDVVHLPGGGERVSA